MTVWVRGDPDGMQLRSGIEQIAEERNGVGIGTGRLVGVPTDEEHTADPLGPEPVGDGPGVSRSLDQPGRDLDRSGARPCVLH